MKIERIRISAGSQRMRELLASYLKRSRQLDHIIEDSRACKLERLPAEKGKPSRIRADVPTRAILGKFLTELEDTDEAIRTAFSFWEGRKSVDLANYIGVATVVSVSEDLTERVSKLYESKLYKPEFTVEEMTNMLGGGALDRERVERMTPTGPVAA